MISSFNTKNGKVHCLDKECILDLHALLSKNIVLIKEMDPVEPPGVKNIGMLESAIGRQSVGSGSYYKYDNCFSNAATLVYGVIKNHAFHNGNKRAGLLALIKHLYVNGYVLSPSLKGDDLYDFLIAVADSKLKEFWLPRRKRYRVIPPKGRKIEDPWDDDTNINFMQVWIKNNSTPQSNTFKGSIKVSTLKRVLANKNIFLEQRGNSIEVYLEKENTFLGLGFGKKKQNIRMYSLGDNSTNIDKQTLQTIRREFKLTKSDGVDNEFFYDEEAFLDEEIKAYKSIIYRLSKT